MAEEPEIGKGFFATSERRSMYGDERSVQYFRPKPTMGWRGSALTTVMDTPHMTHQSDGTEGRLFDWNETPGTSIVELAGAASPRDAKHLASMLGIAQIETWKRHGLDRNLRPSDDLSEHSAPIVEKLRNRGVVNEGQFGGVTNAVSYEDFQAGPNVYLPSEVRGKVVPRSVAREGRRIAVDALRGGPRTKPTPEPEQYRLF